MDGKKELHWQKVLKKTRKLQSELAKTPKKVIRSAKKRDRLMSGSTPTKNKKGRGTRDGETEGTEDHHTSVKHILMPYEDIAENALNQLQNSDMDLVSEDEEEEDESTLTPSPIDEV